MKILIITQYFPPETGAPQNRLYEMAVRLQKKGNDITILTAMPNYPQMVVHKSYKGKVYFSEWMEGMKILRSYIFVSKSKSILKRLLNYFSFVFSSLLVGIFKGEKYDYVICESPPLFLGISAFLIHKFKSKNLIFNVSDLWPETAEKLGLVSNSFLLKLSKWLEEFMYKKSTFITGQTQGIVRNISSRFPNKKVFWIPNGIDMERFNPELIYMDWRKDNNFEKSDFILLYAGIIGYAQGLDVILKAAEILKEHQNIKFVLLGDGPEKNRLLDLRNTLKLNNIFFIDVVEKSQMPGIINSIDASIIPLLKLDLFKGAIPSKIFENLSMKKPILLGVEGEAKELFIDKGNCGLFFDPENFEDLSLKILQLYQNKHLSKEFSENGYRFVRENFTRDIITETFLKLLLDHE